MKRKIWAQILLISLMFLTACGGGGGSSDSTGTISVSLTDSSTDDYKAIYITVAELAVHRDNGDGWEVISSPNKTYNLLELVNGVRQELALTTLESGHYTQMRLILTDTPDGSENILLEPHPDGNYFINKSNQSVPLKIPSGFQTGIKIVKGFDINESQTTEIILDFDATRSIVKAGSSGQWLLKPTIKVMETREYAIISGNVTQLNEEEVAEPAVGVLVSAQIYDSSADPEQKVQIEAATISDENGNYSLFLRPGSYTLVAYKDEFATFYKDTKVVTAAGNTYTEDIELGAAVPTGNLSIGPVTISGPDPYRYATISIRQNVTVSGTAEQIEVKSLNVADGGTLTGIILPVGDYTAVISSDGKTTITETFSIAVDLNTPIESIPLE